MSKFFKYYPRSFSLVLLISLFITNVSICRLVINCESEKTSRCCKQFSDNTFKSEMIEKSCCCEIKVANQPAENTLALSDSKQISFTHFLNTHQNHSFDIYALDKFSVRALSFHSPPRKNIYILNSNFRI